MTTTTDPFAAAPAGIGGAEDDKGVARDGYGRYLLPDPTGRARKAKAFTRATTFAKSISDTFTLSQWSQRMAIKGVTMRPALYAAVASTPIDDKAELNKLAEQAKDVAGAKDAAALGTALHAFTEQHDRGEDPQVPPPWDRDVTAYAALLDEHGLTIEPGMVERIVLCLTYEIAGTFDRIVRLTRDMDVTMPNGEVRRLLAGSLVMFDLKTGRDLSYGWNEIAIQLALYANAELIYDKPNNGYIPMPDGVRTDVAFVLHLPVGKATATLHAVDIAEGWQAAWLCRQVRQWRKHRKLAAPIAVAETPALPTDRLRANGTDRIIVSAERADDPNGDSPNPAAEVEVHAPDVLDRIRTATTIDELRRLRTHGMMMRTWSPTHETAALARMSGILADTAAG